MITQVSSGELNKNRNLAWTKMRKACLILIFSTNTNCESMAYRSFRFEEYRARGVRKVTTGMTTGEGVPPAKYPSVVLTPIVPVSDCLSHPR